MRDHTVCLLKECDSGLSAGRLFFVAHLENEKL